VSSGFKLGLLAASLLLLAAISWYGGERLVRPATALVGMPPANFSQAVSVSFQSDSGLKLHGWAATGQAGRGAILLLHPKQADRRFMLSRALFLQRLGYGVLLIDLHAHGESEGKQITFGDQEALDAVAAIRWMRGYFPGEPLGAIGVSLGGGALLLAPQPLGLKAVVLESSYPSVREALDNRLTIHFGRWGPTLGPLLLWQFKPRLGVSADQIRPIDHIDQLNTPLLMIHGAADQHALVSGAQAMLARAQAPKSLWIIPGAAHIDLHGYAPAAYEAQIADFFGHYLSH
jgi:fermentation-respiration switch protein FrsA (DUF1100 family)